MGQESKTTEEAVSEEEEATTTQEVTESTAQEAGDVDAEAAKRDYHVKKLRDEAARYRSEAREAQEQLKAIEDAEKSEAEKASDRADAAEKERDEAVTRANNTLIRSAVVNEAAKQKAVDPDVVLALLPDDAVSITDDGEVEGAEEAVKALLESKPFLLGDQKKASAGDSGGGVREDTPTMTPEEVRNLAKKDPAEFNKRFEAGEIPASAMGG